MAGPWKVAETPGGFAPCEVWRDPTAGDPPFAVVADRASRAAPAGGRG